MKHYTDITILVDSSGSMQSIKSAMEEAYQDLLRAHRKVESTRFTLITFGGDMLNDIVYLGTPVLSAQPLVLHPEGGTPLNDALCLAIDQTGRRLARLPESARPDQVLFVIITDGQENTSKKFTRHNVKQRITTQSEQFKWQFLYLGANVDAFTEAASYGIKPNWAMNFSPSTGGLLGSTSALITNTVGYTSAKGGARGQSVSSFTQEQRQQAMEEADHDAKLVDLILNATNSLPVNISHKGKA